MSRQASTGIILGGLLNIALDPLFMFVLLPEGSEVLGAGIATCLSNCVAFLYFAFILIRLRRDSVITFSPRAGLPKRENTAAVFAVGVPSALTSLLFDLDYVIIDKLMVSYHDVALAAVGIVLKVERFPLNVGVGICQGMMPLVAYNYSAGNGKRMRDTIRLSRLVGLVVAAVSILLYELFAVQFAGLFIGDAQTVALASQFLRVRVLATPLMFLCFFHGVPVPGVRQGARIAVPRREPLAGAQHPHAVFAQRHLRHVRHRLGAGGGGSSGHAAFLLRAEKIPAHPHGARRRSARARGMSLSPLPYAPPARRGFCAPRKSARKGRPHDL